MKVLNEHGAKALGKPMGSYLTLEADKLLMPDEDFHSEVSDELALLLKGLLKQKTGKKYPGSRAWKSKRNPGLPWAPDGQ